MDIIQKLLDICLEEFYKIMNKKADIKIEFTDDLCERAIQLSVNNEEKNLLIKNRNSYKHNYALSLKPKNINGTFYIIIQNDIFNYKLEYISNKIPNNIHKYDFIKVIYKLMLKIYNFIDFAEYYKIQNYELVNNHPKILPYHCWSNFHSQRLSYTIFRAVVFS